MRCVALVVVVLLGSNAVTPVVAQRLDLHALLSVMEVQHELGRGLLALLASTLLDEQKAADASPVKV